MLQRPSDMSHSRHGSMASKTAALGCLPGLTTFPSVSLWVAPSAHPDGVQTRCVHQVQTRQRHRHSHFAIVDVKICRPPTPRLDSAAQP